MNRPDIKTFFPEGTSPADINKAFLEQPELYRYIQSLDGYIDHLEKEQEENISKAEYSQYLLFTIHNHDTSGGLADILEDYGSVEAFEWQKPQLNLHHYDRWYLWDRITGTTIQDSVEQ